MWTPYLGQSQVHLHLHRSTSMPHAPYTRQIPLPSYQQVSASGTGRDAESKQLFCTGISSGISQNSGSREQAWSQNSFHSLYGLTATGGLKETKPEKKQPSQRDSKQLLLWKTTKCLFSHIHSCEGFNISPTMALLIIHLQFTSLIHQYSWTGRPIETLMTPSSSKLWSDF